MSSSAEVVRLSQLANILGQRWKQRRQDGLLRDAVGLDGKGNIILKGDFTFGELQSMAETLPVGESVIFLPSVNWAQFAVRRVEGKKVIGLVKPGHQADVMQDISLRAEVILSHGKVKRFVSDDYPIGPCRVEGGYIHNMPLVQRKIVFR